MTHRLTNNYAKNYCNRTLIVEVIIENVVTCFFGKQCSLNPGQTTLWLRCANTASFFRFCCYTEWMKQRYCHYYCYIRQYITVCDRRDSFNIGPCKKWKIKMYIIELPP